MKTAEGRTEKGEKLSSDVAEYAAAGRKKMSERAKGNDPSPKARK